MLTSERTEVVPATLYLPVRGPAQVAGPAGRLQLRRKALAIIYYLAFEGSTRRERLADLLWDGMDPLANLRVELNAINAALRPYGIVFSDRYQDPLEFPASLQLDLNGSGSDEDLLDGLDGLGDNFQEWLDWRRSRLRSAAPARFDFSAEMDALVRKLRAPHLLVVEPQPCETALAFVEVLSQRLRLPLLPYAASGNGLRYTAPPLPEGIVGRIQSERGSIWVFERPFFGDDPSELLKLRTVLPASNMSYLRLPGTSWFSERSGRLAQLEFDAAARLYLAASGHPGYLAEILEFANVDPLPVPQKYRAAIELEIRKLSGACRAVLVGLAVRSRFINERSAAVSLDETRECLTELVEKRWLEYAGAGWRFTSSFARNTIYRSLPEGLRQATHREQAELLSQLGRNVQAGIQRLMAGEDIDPADFRDELELWAQEALDRHFDLPGRVKPAQPQPAALSRNEGFIEAARPYGEGVEQAGTTNVLVRHGQSSRPSGVAFTLPAEPMLLQLSGRARIRNSLGIGLFGDAVPLRLRRNDEVVATLAPGQMVGRAGTELLLPLPGQFTYWFRSRGAQQLSVESSADNGIVEFELRCFEEAQAGQSVDAWALDA